MNSERIKARLIATHEYARTLLLWLAVIAVCIAVYALWTWRNAENVVGATSADVQNTLKGVREILDTLNTKIDSIDTSRINDRVTDLGKTQAELDRLLVSIRLQTAGITSAATDRINQLDGNLSSLRRVTDEVSHQVKQNGDQAAVTLASLNKTITDVDTRFSKILEDGSLMLETSNPKLQSLLENANNVVIDLDGRVKAFEPLQANLTGITADFNAMTTDSKNKLHEILFPAPKHGWARVGQVATYLLRPIFEGARLYFQLTALPVRLTEPIPILK